MLNHARTEVSTVHAERFFTALQQDGAEKAGRQPEFATASLLSGALDLLRMSVILTDASAQIIYANRHGRGLLSEQRCLRVCAGRLSAVNPKNSLQIRHAIRRCAESDAAPMLTLGIAVPLLRSDERCVAAWILPMRQKSDRGDIRHAAIFIRSTIDLFSEEMFASIFGATLAELRVVKLLLGGMSIHEVSDALKLSANTVRTHVKSLFAKTGTTRQAQLLRLAALSIAPVSAGNV